MLPVPELPRRVRPEPAERSSPRALVVSLWLTALGLSLFAAADLRAWLVHDSAWVNVPPLQAIIRGLVTASQVTRAWAMHDELDALAAGIGAELSARDAATPPDAEPSPAAPPVAGKSSASAAGAPPALEGAPQRILLIGESSIQFYLGSELERSLSGNYEGLTLRRFGKLGTSLTRPDVFDWPKKVKQLLGEFHPDLVIANFGGNDAQNIAQRGSVLRFGTPAWDEAYGVRVERLVQLVQAHAARFVLIGMPIMRTASFSRRMKHINALMESRVRAAGAEFLSVWDLSTDERGAYRNAIEVDGVQRLMRLADGHHYSRAGARYVARALTAALELRFRLVPKATPGASLPPSEGARSLEEGKQEAGR